MRSEKDAFDVYKVFNHFVGTLEVKTLNMA